MLPVLSQAKLNSFDIMFRIKYCDARKKSVGANMFKADKAITSPDEDLCGFSDAANRLAESILKWKVDNSLIIGINGTWGIG